MDPLRVVLGEDDALLRECLPLVMARQGLDVVDVESHTDRLVERADTLAPDLVVVDLGRQPSPPEDGLRAAGRIRHVAARTPIALVTSCVRPRGVGTLLQEPSPGIGYLLRHRIGNATAFCADLHRVAAGETVVDSEVMNLFLNPTEEQREIEQLTRRQRDVLDAMAQGRSNAAIARSLGISEKAVVQHASHIYDQFGLAVTEDSHRRVRAVLRYLESEGGQRLVGV